MSKFFSKSSLYLFFSLLIGLSACSKNKQQPIDNSLNPLNSSAKQYTQGEVDHDFDGLAFAEDDLWSVDITFQYASNDSVVGINVFPSNVSISERMDYLEDYLSLGSLILNKYSVPFLIADADVIVHAQLRGDRKAVLEKKQELSRNLLTQMARDNGFFKPTPGEKGSKPEKIGAKGMLDIFNDQARSLSSFTTLNDDTLYNKGGGDDDDGDTTVDNH